MNKITKIAKFFGLLAIIGVSQNAGAAEITAVDFYGKVLGQVISTGMVVGPSGENIGSITADSFVVNGSGEIIGGVIPQGIVIGNDNKLLGKIYGDGIVRSFTGKDLGKALPNGLVVNGNFDIIGTILFPGLIYSDEGLIVGRMTGSGSYTDLDGRELGFVSANGYAYRREGTDFVIDGRLMSSKMVVSLDGKFMGSIAPSGKVIDFEGKELGNIHANGFVYSAEGKVIGRIVASGFAFDLNGKYLGFVSYNGAVMDRDKEIARYRADGNIVDSEGKVIGTVVSAAATANDKAGKYLGRVLPTGNVVKGSDVVGKIGARGNVYNDKGEQIGNIVSLGPVYNALGKLKGESLSNGTVVSLGGSNIGYMIGSYAFDTNGLMLGSLNQNKIAFSSTNTPLGVVGVSGTISNGAEKNSVSPYGYIYNSDGKISGQCMNIQPTYSLAGSLYSYIAPDGNLYRGLENVKLTMNGILMNKNGYAGSTVSSYFNVGFSAPLGFETADNIILNDKGDKTYKVIPQNYVVPYVGDEDQSVMPVVGYSGNDVVAVSIGGDLLGYADNQGNVTDLNRNVYGKVINDGYVTDNSNSVTGRLLPFGSVINDKCNVIGVVNGNGDVVNVREIIIGRMITNGQVISDVGSYTGYTVWEKGLIDFDGNYSGVVVNGSGMDYEGRNIGCINRQGVIVDGDKHWKYGVIRQTPVIDSENQIIGQILADGTVADAKSKIIGYVQPNGNVVSKSKKTLGQAMRYKVAFNNENHFIGMVQNSGAVMGQNGEVAGWVNFDGSVVDKGETIGYALYDFYVYDNNFTVYGYLTKDGVVLSSVGSKLGEIEHGFVVNRNGEVVARGNRDYTIRDASLNTVGELALDGNVVDYEGKNVGYLAENGVIKNSAGDAVAQAYLLQYYTPTIKPTVQEEDWADRRKVGIQEEVIKTEKPKNQEQTIKEKISDMSRRIIGIALSPDGDILGDIYEDNTVFDSSGKQVGYRTPDGVIIDMDYNPIGIEEIKKTSADTMFIPAGAFGNGNAYGIGSHPSNLGPGGGYGQGERYSPERVQVLSQLQQRRRSGFAVGSLGKVDMKDMASFTGYEEDGWWPNKNISSWRVDMSEMILQDKPIPAVLSRSVYASDNMGENVPVTAIVERNIYAEDGRNIIIPAGSRAIGALGGTNSTGGNSGGAVKIGITWRRLIRPDGSQFLFSNAQTADAQGRAGAIGYLDEQLLKKYATPLMTTMLESATSYLMAAGNGESTSDGTTTTSSKSKAADDARENFLQQMGQIFEDIVREKANIRAVTYIPAGTRIIIFPNEDLWLNSIERSKKKSSSGKDDEGGGGGNNGLTEKNPNSRRTSGGGAVAYDGTMDESVAPATSLTESSPNANRRRQQAPTGTAPASTLRQSAPVNRSNQETSAVPDLL